MDHRLVIAIENALSWGGSAPMGTAFARGSIQDTDLLTRLLTPYKLLDVIMRRSLSNPQFRLFQGGGELHPHRYITPSVTRRGQAIPMADMARVGALLTEGATIVLDELQVFDLAMETACRALQWWSHELVQVNAYLTTQDAEGFPLHWDDHDVVIVQLAGSKTWEVRSTSRPVPLYRDAAPNNEPSETIVWAGTMQTGDVMHIPRGYWHQATRADRGKGDLSLHVTFGFVKRNGVNWLTWLADQGRELQLFRTDLDRTDSTAQDSGLARAVAALAEQHPASAYLAAREREQSTARYLPALDILGPITTLACVTEFPPVIEADDHQVVVTAASRQLTLAPRATAALRLMLSGTPVAVDRPVEGLTITETRQLAATLLQEGLCAPITPESSWAYTDLRTTATPSKPRSTSA